ncbi:MAG: GNAT family N-acetyltransferase [Planctomycetes bacterium]|nr:GNAT family N-acetyltransferase [Planctomycetota bacterium]MBI3836148.1 GNAT family N-acetyltransferase [Planctomycetota bacterium]
MTQREKSEGSQVRSYAQLPEFSIELSVGGRHFALTPFQPTDAASLLQWVNTPTDLRWLAPNTSWPLTEEKIYEWTARGGQAFVLRSMPGRVVVGYGEVNAFAGRGRETWIGHVIIEPGRRGRGLGTALVGGMLQCAFVNRRASRVSLIVFPENVAAVHCYLRAGFRVAGSEHHRAADSPDLLSLTRLEMSSKDYKAISGMQEVDE